MRHDLRLEGYAFALRPVTLEDAEFIVQVRTSDPQRVRYLHPISPDVGQQREWLNRYFERQNDYYWVVERIESKEREGLIAIYDFDTNNRSAEWGRWVLRPGSFAAIESALLVYRAAFEKLQLEAVCPCTVLDNRAVVSFHESCGLPRHAVLKNHYQFHGQTFDAVKHICTRSSWPVVCQRLESQARLLAERLERGRSKDVAVSQ
jgi:RimJ/RimL family protein N-acetyltransferase